MSFNLIAITRPEFMPDEAQAIYQLLDTGAVGRVHLRKPGCRESQMRDLIERLPSHLHCRLSLHDWHALAAEYGCGIHLNSRNPVPLSDFDGIISRSCHCVEELDRAESTDYQFLSPIYPSISKPGYAPPFSIDELRGCLPPATMALGGVEPAQFPELMRIGFDGAAMLGYIWERATKHQLSDLIHELKCCNS